MYIGATCTALGGVSMGQHFFCVAPTVTPHGARSTVNWGLAFEVVLVTFGPLLVKQQWKEIDTGCWG